MRYLISQNVIRSLGIVLLCAAVLKTAHMFSVPLSKWMAVGSLLQVLVETALGIWFVGGIDSVAKWRGACLCFGTFAVVAAIQAARGADSCGCFGSLHVFPWLILVFDVTVVGTLVFLRSRDSSSQRQSGRRSASLLLIGCGSCVFLTTLAILGQSRFDDDSPFTKVGDLIVLHPEQWVGKPFALASKFVVEGNLSQGEWDVLLFSNHCNVCHEVMADLLKQLNVRRPSKQIALIALDGDSREDLVAKLEGRGCAIGYVSDDGEWFTTTPLRVRLTGGICIQATVVDQWE